jgi:shikimate 5-dehydrogenase
VDSTGLKEAPVSDTNLLAGAVGAEVSHRLEPLAHQYLSSDGPTLTCERIESDADRRDLFEDIMEFLAKEGMLGIHVLWPNRPHASARAKWLASADAAGCVDTLVFRDHGDRVPLGANVTADAFIDLFAQFGVEPRGTTLLYGAGHTARSLVSAVHTLGASKVLVYDPRPGRTEAIIANVDASEEQRGFVEKIDDPYAALLTADGFADCLSPAAGRQLDVPGQLRWWFDGPGRQFEADPSPTVGLLPGWCLSVYRAARARALWLDEPLNSTLVERSLALMAETVRQCTGGSTVERFSQSPDLET